MSDWINGGGMPLGAQVVRISAALRRVKELEKWLLYELRTEEDRAIERFLALYDWERGYRFDRPRSS